MTQNARTRMTLVALIGVNGALVLLLTLLTVRTVLLNQVDRSADEAIVDGVDEFIASVEGGQSSEDLRAGSGEQLDTEEALMREFLARRAPEEHTVLVAVSGGETILLDNSQEGMGQRFVEESPAFDSLLQADAASGAEAAPGFGEIRWGKVLTDQDGAFLVVHFTAAAEEDVADTLWTFTWISTAALLLVSAASWFGIGLVQQILGRRRRRRHDDADWMVTPVRPLPDEATEPTVPLNDLMVPADLEKTAGLENTAGLLDSAGAGRLQRTSAASLMLRAQHRLQQHHPEHRFVLTLEGREHGAGHTADVLGTLAQTEAELDVEAVEAEYLNLVAEALERAELGTAVVLGAGLSPRAGGEGPRLRLSVNAGSPATSSMTVPLEPERTTPLVASARADSPSQPGALVGDSVLTHS
ncbi:hypothetical protein ACFP47_01445 [Nesterenkonia lacusekhoensis]|uniref:HAMP domain-containing protein n=1 Tax=Nesterenkonia lacusekhoensis TaxID=150832 RepID=A0ABS4T5W8_9MICC|nr:hypothetical protein [Nesterenkonia lacusekhoensis]MBP2319374.1 hypothetical protein [Nesterenkonia lacusekhoensis]